MTKRPRRAVTSVSRRKDAKVACIAFFFFQIRCTTHIFYARIKRAFHASKLSAGRGKARFYIRLKFTNWKVRARRRITRPSAIKLYRILVWHWSFNRRAAKMMRCDAPLHRANQCFSITDVLTIKGTSHASKVMTASICSTHVRERFDDIIRRDKNDAWRKTRTRRWRSIFFVLNGRPRSNW